MTLKPTPLLRRTLMAAATIVVAAAALPLHAGGVKKAEDNSSLCTTFTSASVTPDGGISISGCSSSTVIIPPQPTPFPKVAGLC